MITVAGMVMLKGELARSVEKDSWTWTLDKGRLGIMLAKTNPGTTKEKDNYMRCMILIQCCICNICTCLIFFK